LWVIKVTINPSRLYHVEKCGVFPLEWVHKLKQQRVLGAR